MKVATILDRIWNEKLAPLPPPTEKKEEFKQQRKFDRSTTLYFTDTGYSRFEEINSILSMSSLVNQVKKKSILVKRLSPFFA